MAGVWARKGLDLPPMKRSSYASLLSFPLGVPPEGRGEFWVAIAAADRAFDEIDPPASRRRNSGGR